MVAHMSTAFHSERGTAGGEPQAPPFPRAVEERAPGTIALRRRSPLKFFLLLFGLSVPFWLAGALAERQLLPGLPVVYALIAFFDHLVTQWTSTGGVSRGSARNSSQSRPSSSPLD
jgi:hypothetical protein